MAQKASAGEGLNAIAMISIVKSLIHTFIRFLPLGLYSFTYFSIALYKDLRSAILLLGMILNDVIGLLFNKYSKIKPPATCAIFKRPVAENKISDMSQYRQLGILPNPHTEIIGFVTAFFISDMFAKGKFDVIPGWFLIILTIATGWSRMSVQCEEFNDVLFNVMRGSIIGMLFFYFFKDYYKNAEEGVLEREKCDMGYKNYKCDTIQDGVVIVKKTGNKKEEKDDEETMNSYYD